MKNFNSYKVKTHYFNFLEPFLVSPILAALGFLLSKAFQYLTSSEHFLTWTPLVILGIPFVIFWGLIIPLELISLIFSKK